MESTGMTRRGFLATAAVGTAAGAEAGSNEYFCGDRVVVECLAVGVADYEVAALYLLLVHIRNGIATASSYAYDFDD